jgi:hypothetical protein
MGRRWLPNPIGWIRPGDDFIYRGDFRMRLQAVSRDAVGVREHVWQVIFKKGPAYGSARERSFSKSVFLAWWRAYMRYLEWDDHPPSFLPKFLHRAVLR